MYLSHSDRHRTALFRSLIALSLVGCSAVYAADENSGEKRPPIEEIVISSSYTTNDKLNSATGLGLSIQETPQSVSVMTFQRMQDQDLTSLTDVVNNAAGISAKERDSARDFYASRGFVIDNYQIDGVPMAWSSGGDAGETQTDTAIYERVEIVRGATGLLTGVGSPAASVNLVRKHADSREFSALTSIGTSRWDSFNAMVDLSTPLNANGSVRGRAVVNYEDGDSYVDLLGNKKSVFYATVDADLTDYTLLRVGGSYQDNDPTASTWGGLPVWYADSTRTDWDRSKTIGADWTRWASTSENYFANLIHTFANGWKATVDVTYADNSAEMQLLYLYGTPDRVTGLGLSPSPYGSDTTREQTGVGLHVSGSYPLFGREHEVTLGYTYSDQNFVTYYFPESNIAPVGNFNEWDGSYPKATWGARTTDVDTDTEQTGFYAASRLLLTDSLNLIVGGRVADWEQTGEQYGSPVDYGDSGVFIPYAGALYDFNDAHTFYVSYTEIFEPQSNQDRNGNFLDPLTGKSSEIGLKSAFMEELLHTTVTVFRIDQDNLAQPDPGFFIPGTIFQASRAAQGTVSEGFEFEVVGEPVQGWDISFSYTQFTADDADGVEVNTDQPRKLLKLFTTYNFSGNWENLTIGGGVNWEGGNYTDTVNPVTAQPERLEQEAYSLVNLMMRYDFSAQLSAQINVENLLDETYYSQIGFYDQLAYGDPRNISLQMKYRF